MFNDKVKIYLLLIISFILLFVSLIFSLNNLNNNTQNIENIEKQHLNLSSKIADLNYKLKKKQSDALQSILLQESPREHPHISAKLINEINALSKEEKVLGELLRDKIIESKSSNELSQKTVAISFLVAVFLIIFSIIKLNRLQTNLKSELQRTKKAEDEQKNLQQQLLKYNENLEDEITKKTNELYQRVYTHFLSGLPNRNKLLEDSSIYKFSQIALLNIDSFQKFNDVYGEEMGNMALQKTAKFISDFFPTDEAIAYQIGGDEFAIIVKESSNVDDDRFIQDVNDFLKIYKKEVFEIEDTKYSFIMSSGIAFGSGKKILAYADMALKDAKNRKVMYSIFNEEKGLEKIHKEDIETKNKLINAFEVGGLISHYQPISPIQNDLLEIKYESLIRLQDGEKIISPLAFIDIAKQNKMYYKITRVVFKNTLETITKYMIPCSINLSIVDIHNDRTLEYIYNLLDNFEHNNLITIELLETEEFDDYDKVYNFCTKIRSYGIKIALDDFGAGYSNFSHILNLPIDYIKIDASLISNIDRDTHSQIMVETIVGLAHKLNILTIAEFVSSKEILKTIKKLNVDYAQGYYVGKPEEISHYIPYE